MRKAVYVAEFDRLICQQAHRPTAQSVGRIGAGEQGNARFQFPRHFAGGGWPHRFVFEGGFQALGEKPATDIADGVTMAAKNVGDFFVRARLVLGTVEQQQNASPCLFAGGVLPGVDQAFKLLALLGRKG